MTFKKDEPFDTAHGPTCNFRYLQEGRCYDATFVRVNPETGNVWTERDDQVVEDIVQLEKDGKKDPVLKSAAKAAKEGVKLPTRILERNKK